MNLFIKYSVLVFRALHICDGFIRVWVLRLIPAARNGVLIFSDTQSVKGTTVRSVKLIRENHKSRASLVKVGDRFFIEKKFKKNSFREFFKFFSEFSIYQKLADVECVPKLTAMAPTQMCLYLEFIDGVTWSEFLKRSPPHSCGLYMQHIECAYKTVHKVGVLHMDVTGKNILLDQKCRVKIIDFADSVSLSVLPKWLRCRYFERDFSRLKAVEEKYSRNAVASNHLVNGK